MKVARVIAIFVAAAIGCAPSTGGGRKAEAEPSEASPPPAFTANSTELPPRVTNQFGMTFRLVEVDPSRADHQDSFPKRSFYLQETELTWEQHAAFREAAFGDGKYETIDWHYNSGSPSEWIEVIQYAEALSKFDRQYDYALPSKSQWTFACRSGYEQVCDEDKPNSLGFVDMLDRDVEVIGEYHTMKGFKYGIVMGLWANNWGENIGKAKPNCSCEHWTTCNPQADDGLNELIVGRFILLPEKPQPGGKASATGD